MDNITEKLYLCNHVSVLQNGKLFVIFFRKVVQNGKLYEQ